MATNFHVIAGPHESLTRTPVVRRIGPGDLREALRKGLDDFMAIPTHLVFLGLLYPLFGIGLGALTFTNDAPQLLFPLVSGFALLGPLAAVGLYELSRRRELGLDSAGYHAFDVLRSPALPAILALGVVLLVIFVAWLLAAQAIYSWIYGPEAPESYTAFLSEIFTTSRGWLLIIVGHAVGLVFAAVVLSISVISFPLLLDRDVGAAVAIQTSVKAVLANPGTMAIWGLVVAALLMIGSAPLLVGLAVVVPVLGHASWHLYRRVVEPAS